MDEYDMIIVGSGPAGLTAAIYSGRQNFKTLVLERALTGGNGLMVPLMGNYPGFDMISGKELVEVMKAQALKYSEIKELEEVEKIEYNEDMLEITTTKDIYRSKSIILATGSKHRLLNIPGEAAFLGRGVSYCATCDGPLFVDRKVLVIGGGNSAAQQAIYLNNMGVTVTIVHRRDELRAEIYLQKLLEEKNIPIIWNSELKEIEGDQLVQNAVLYNSKTGEEQKLATDGVFISVGEIPAYQLAKDLGVEIDKHGYIVTDKGQRTNLPRIYAAGDITVGNNQWLIACSEGAIAALSAFQDTKL